jgi:hypothetical protein
MIGLLPCASALPAVSAAFRLAMVENLEANREEPSGIHCMSLAAEIVRAGCGMKQHIAAQCPYGAQWWVFKPRLLNLYSVGVSRMSAAVQALRSASNGMEDVWGAKDDATAAGQDA